MKILVAILSAILVVVMSGCVASGPKVVIDKNRAPLNVNQVASLQINGGGRETVQRLVGNPIEMRQEGRTHYWTYPVKDELLSKETTIIVEIGYSSGVNLTKSISDLPFKEVDLDRDKYFYLKNNLKKSGKGVKYLGIKASREERDNNENEKMHAKESKQKYKDQLFELKQKILKERGKLPTWFNIKL